MTGSLRKAENLRVSVISGGTPRVNLTFKAVMASSLRDLLPPHLTGKVAEQGIDLDRLSAECEAEGFVPRDLFKLVEGEKTVRVWLE